MLRPGWNKVEIKLYQRCFSVVSTSYTDVVSTLCNVENPTSDFVSFSTSDQRYFKCWLGHVFLIKCQSQSYFQIVYDIFKYIGFADYSSSTITFVLLALAIFQLYCCFIQLFVLSKLLCFKLCCVKSVQIRSYFWSEYRKIRTRNNSVFGHLSRSDCVDHDHYFSFRSFDNSTSLCMSMISILLNTYSISPFTNFHACFLVKFIFSLHRSSL